MEQTIKEYIHYLQEVKHASKNTVQSYYVDLLQFTMFLRGQGVTELASTKETMLQSFLLTLEGKKMSTSTIQRKLTSIKGFYLFLLKKRAVSVDITERIQPPKLMSKNFACLSVEQMEHLLTIPDQTTIRGIRDQAMLELLYATGIKVSELVSIRFEEINLKLSYLIVPSSKGERVLPFGRPAKEAIMKYLKELQLNQPEISKDSMTASIHRSNTYLFVNRFGKPISRQGFWKILKQYAYLANMPSELTPQMIRNSFACHMILNGADYNSVMELMGYENVSVLKRFVLKEKENLREIYRETHPRGI